MKLRSEWKSTVYRPTTRFFGPFLIEKLRADPEKKIQQFSSKKNLKQICFKTKKFAYWNSFFFWIGANLNKILPAYFTKTFFTNLLPIFKNLKEFLDKLVEFSKKL